MLCYAALFFEQNIGLYTKYMSKILWSVMLSVMLCYAVLCWFRIFLLSSRLNFVSLMAPLHNGHHFFLSLASWYKRIKQDWQNICLHGSISWGRCILSRQIEQVTSISDSPLFVFSSIAKKLRTCFVESRKLFNTTRFDEILSKTIKQKKLNQFPRINLT